MDPTSPLERIGPFDVLEVLKTGRAGTIYRARHADRGELVALKTLQAVDPVELESFRRETHALKEIHHPGVVRIVAEGLDEPRPWYAMELIDGGTIDDAWRRREGSDDPLTRIASVVRLVRRLCEALAFIHGEGIVHRDLKPTNVLVRSEGQPVIVDFGFWSRFGGAQRGREALEAGGDILGTVEYMAPEQVRGEYVDARADLYSLGCLLYEALIGEPPFTGSPWKVMEQQLQAEPKPPSARVDGLPRELDGLILRLLAKRPSDRPGYAADVAAVLARIIEDDELPVASSVRPYLYRPSFADRREPMLHLTALLDRAMTDESRLVLIRGESGSGKTRLAMELTRQAAQRELLIATGECLQVQGRAAASIRGAPLHPLRPLLRAIVAHCRSRDREETERLFGRRGKVLAAYEPTIDSLPGQDEQPDLIPLPAEAARARVISSLTETIAEFTSGVPTVVILDDLQWADELTLGFLLSLSASFLARGRVLIVGTQRAEEPSAELDELREKPFATLIALERMDRPTINAIVSDMLAIDGLPDPFLDFVRRESEGNPFFISEYLHTAVELGYVERSGLGNWRLRDAATDFTALTTPGTLREVIERRLAGLDRDARLVLEAAAVLGREFEAAAAAEIAGLEVTSQLRSIRTLVVRHVIEETPSGALRFTHDKLREVAYGGIEATRASALHRRAAEIMETQLARGTGSAPRYALIAHHWWMGGSTEKARFYFGRAGETALASGAHREAHDSLSRALELDEKSLSKAELIDRVRWRRMRAAASFGIGDLAETVADSSRALRELGHRVPVQAPRWLPILAGQLLLRVRRRILPGSIPRDREPYREAAVASVQLATASFYAQDSMPLFCSLLRCLNLAEQAGDTEDIAYACASLGYVAGATRMGWLARAYFQRAYRLADQHGHTRMRGLALYLDAMYQCGFAEWQGSERAASESVTLLENISDPQEAETAKAVLANILCYRGDFARAETLSREIFTTAANRSNVEHVAWGMYLTARSRVAVGAAAEAADLAEQAREKLLRSPDLISLVMCEGTLARALYSSGQFVRALVVGKALAERLDRPLPIALGQCIDGYVGATDVLVGLWRLEERAGRNDTRALARAQCGRLRSFAWLFPIAQPAALRNSAWEAKLLGRNQATQLAVRSLHTAERLKMPYEQALAHATLARFEGGAGAREHTAQAREIAERLGCEDAVERYFDD